jgi:hypothetical protein
MARPCGAGRCCWSRKGRSGGVAPWKIPETEPIGINDRFWWRDLATVWPGLRQTSCSADRSRRSQTRMLDDFDVEVSSNLNKRLVLEPTKAIFSISAKTSSRAGRSSRAKRSQPRCWGLRARSKGSVQVWDNKPPSLYSVAPQVKPSAPGSATPNPASPKPCTCSTPPAPPTNSPPAKAAPPASPRTKTSQSARTKPARTGSAVGQPLTPTPSLSTDVSLVMA